LPFRKLTEKQEKLQSENLELNGSNARLKSQVSFLRLSLFTVFLIAYEACHLSLVAATGAFGRF